MSGGWSISVSAKLWTLALDCDCRFNSNGDATCDSPLADGRDDPDDSCGVLTCNGAGSCNVTDGGACATDQTCESNRCECSNAGCSAHQCSPVDCNGCTFNFDGDDVMCAETSLSVSAGWFANFRRRCLHVEALMVLCVVLLIVVSVCGTVHFLVFGSQKIASK